MSSTIVAEKTWPISDHEMGEPFWAEIVFARSSERDCSAPERRLIPSARSAGVMRGHGPSSKAVRAAATAASMSAGDASGTVPITSSVCGEMTSIVSLLWGETHSPPMNSLSCTFVSVATAASRSSARKDLGTATLSRA